MKLIRPLVFLFLLAPAAQVFLLRQPFEECVRVLGQPQSRRASPMLPATEECTFRSKQWRRTIQFWHGKAHCISYSKLDGAPLTLEERQGLLDRFGQGQAWLRGSNRRFAWRADRNMVAITGGAYGFSIVSAEFVHAVGNFP
jgi:hypothetical protein